MPSTYTTAALPARPRSIAATAQSSSYRPTARTTRPQRQRAAIKVTPFAPVRNTPPKPRSLFGQFKSLAFGLPQGVVGLTKMGINTIDAPLRLPVDLVRGRTQRILRDRPGGLWQDTQALLSEYAPLPDVMGRSIALNTVPRVARTAFLGDDTPYRDAIKEGRIVDVLLEDIGNAAIIAGGVGKALGTTVEASEVGNLAVKGAITGESTGVGRALGAAAGAEAEAPIMSAPRLAASAERAAPMLDPATGRVIKMSVDVPERYTGLAKYAERAGMETTARRMATAGTRIGQAARLGDDIAGAQMAIPAKLIGKGLRAAGVLSTETRPGLLAIAGTRLAENIASGEGRWSDVAARFTPGARQTIRQVGEARSELQGDVLESSRDIMQSLKLADQYGLSQEQASALTFNVDQRFMNAVEQWREAERRGLDPEQTVDQMLQRGYADVDSTQRPTVAAVKAYIEWKDGLLDDVATAGMNRAEQDLRRHSKLATEVRVASGQITPEQTGTAFLPEQVEALRAPLERKRDEAARVAGRGQVKANRAEQYADINEALRTPAAAPQPKEVARISRKAFRQEGEARAKLRSTQQELQRSIDAYAKADREGFAGAEELAMLRSEIERKQADAQRLYNEIEQLSRRRQAYVPLSRVLGGEERVEEVLSVDRPTPRERGDNVVPYDELRRAVNDTHAGQVADMSTELDRLTGGDQLRIPSPSEIAKYPKDATGRPIFPPEYNWYERYYMEPEQVDVRIKSGPQKGQTVKRWKQRTHPKVAEWIKTGRVTETFKRVGQRASEKVAGAGGKRGLLPDEFAERIANAVGDAGGTATLDTHIQSFLDTLDSYIATKKGPNTDTMGMVAERYGIDPEHVATAYHGTADEYLTAIHGEADQALTRLGNVMDEMEPSLRDAILHIMQEERDRGATDFELADALHEALEGIAGRGMGNDVVPSIYGAVDMTDVHDWLTGKPVTRRIYEQLVGNRSLVNERELARMQQRLIDLRTNRTDVQIDQNRLSIVYSTAQRNAERRAQRRIGGAITAEGRAASANAKVAAQAEQFVKDAAEMGKPYKRRKASIKRIEEDSSLTAEQKRYRIAATTDPLSPAERTIAKVGGLRDRAMSLRVTQRRLARNASRYANEVVNLQSELGRGVMERLRTDINRPTEKRVLGVIRRAERELGDVEEGIDKTPYLTGVMGDLAAKYGIGDEVIAAIDNERRWAREGFAPDNKRRAFQTVLDSYGITMDSVDANLLERSFNVDRMLYDAGNIIDDGWLKDQDGVAIRNEDGTLIPTTASFTPLRLREWFNEERLGKMLPEDTINEVDKAFDQYVAKRSAHLERSLDDYLAVMPAPFRAVSQGMRRDIHGLLDHAEAVWMDGDHEQAISLIEMAEQIPDTLDEMVKAGYRPDYLTGGVAPGRAHSAVGSSIKTRSLRATQQMTTGLRPVDLQGVVQLEIQEASSFLGNKVARALKTTMAKRVDDVIGDVVDQWAKDHPHDTVMPSRDLERAVKLAGWVKATEESGPIHRGTQIIPRMIDDELRVYAARDGMMRKTLVSGNRVLKLAVLPFSPKWHIGNIVGNVFMAAGYGGVSPITLARTIYDIAQREGGWKAYWEAGGKPYWAPDDLMTHGFTYNEHVLRWGDPKLGADPGKMRAFFTRAVEESYNLNEFVDNVTRNAVYLVGLRKGLSEAEALQYSLRAMGDFTRMSPFERRWVREVFPFYAWMRHQTMAALRLPLYHPTRAAVLMHLTNMVNDPEYGPDMLAQLGSRVQIGGGWYSFGGLSPFPNPMDLPLDPSAPSFWQGVSPVPKIAARTLMGIDTGGAAIGDISRPSDQQGYGIFGQEIPTSPIRHLLRDPLHGAGEIGYQLAGDLPQTKALRDLALDATGGRLGQFRYQSGNVGPKRYDRPQSILQTIGAGIGLPTPVDIDTEQMLREQTKRDRDARRRAARAG